MINKFCKYNLWEVTKELTDVAMGRTAADMVITNAQLINVCTKEIIPDTSVAIAKGRIALVGDAAHCIGDKTKVIDANGAYISPGFMDGHMHIESSMIIPSEYAKAVIPHGTCGVFYDPHEICNVLGMDGVRFMTEDAKRTPLKAMLTMPSCVPAVPGFEDTGAEITSAEVAEAMTWDECIGLGEMMNFPGINAGADGPHSIVAATLKAGKIVTSHYSILETGAGLNAYISAGGRGCHESTREIDALEKMRRGMYAMLREGSAWHDLQEVSKAITQHKVDSRFAMLVTDDVHPNDLLTKGHLDHVLRKAVEYGIDPLTAIQMVTINAAQCFSLDYDMGSIAPGKCADIVFLKDLSSFEVIMNIIDGEIISENGQYLPDLPAKVFPENVLNTININRELTAEDMKISAEGEDGSAVVRVIEVIPAKTVTCERQIEVPAINGFLCAAPDKDVLKALVFDRHTGRATRGAGFIKGFGIKSGALAQTVAHDAHNLFVVGSNDEDMLLAANTLIKCGGGAVCVKDGQVLALVELKVAGLMSVKPVELVNEDVLGLEKAWEELGCSLPSPFMTMGIVPLACIPELRLTNRGLVDCRTFEFVPLIVK